MSPDVTQHSAEVHFAPMSLPTADWHVAGPSPRHRPHSERREPALNEAENVPHVIATLTQWMREVVLEDVPSHQRARMHGASKFSAVRGVMRGLRRTFREQRHPVVMRELTPAMARSADQRAT